MRQAIIILNLLGSFVVFALTIDFFETALMFLLFGILPGRAQPVDATYMLIVYVWSGIVIVGYVMRRTVIRLAVHMRKLAPVLVAQALRLIRKWQDRLGPQLKLLKQESFVIRLSRRKSLQ